MSKKIISVTVSCYGLKKRGRTSQRHSFELGEVPAESFDIEKITLQAVETVGREMKSLRPGSKVQLYRLPMTLEEKTFPGCRPHVTRSFGCTDGSHVDITSRFPALVPAQASA